MAGVRKVVMLVICTLLVINTAGTFAGERSKNRDFRMKREGVKVMMSTVDVTTA